MAHLIENMFYLGETPWHGLGKKLTEQPTIEEALDYAGMNWKVQKQPSTYRNPRTGLQSDTGHFVNVRLDNGNAIGNVGKKYEVLQNVEAFKPFEIITDYGYTLETAGVIDEGKKVWILAKTPSTFQVGDDEILDYILMYTSHDGSSGSCFRDVPIRVVCNNTLNIALGSKKSHEYKLRHTSSIHERVSELTKNLDTREGNVAQAIDDMNRFHEYEMTPDTLKYYIEAVMPWLKKRHQVSIPEMGIFHKNRAKPVYEKITDLFYNGKGNKGNNLWDAYNAMTEYHDHSKTHGKENKDWVKGTQFGASNRDKIKAYQIATAMTKHAFPDIPTSFVLN